MAKRKAVTREWLQKVGVESVSEDGETIIFKGRVKNQLTISKKHPYGNTLSYKVVAIYDPDNESIQFIDKKYTHKDGSVHTCCARQIRTRNVAVSRLVYAWFKGEAPTDMDVDHIDGNTFNNSISNLQLLTRKENLAKRLLTASQITRMYYDLKRKQKKEDDDTYAIYNKIGEDK